MLDFIKILEKLHLISISYASSDIENTPVELYSNLQNTGNNSAIIFFTAFGIVTLTLIAIFLIIKQKNNVSIEANKSVQVLDKINIDPGCSIVITKIQNSIFILGKTENNITTIEKISNQDDVNLIELDCKSSRNQQSFQTILANQATIAKRYMHQNNKPLQKKKINQNETQTASREVFSNDLQNKL